MSGWDGLLGKQVEVYGESQKIKCECDLLLHSGEDSE